MNKSYIGLGLLVVVILAAGCWAITNKQSGSTASETIKIGVIGPYTGPVAEYGEAHRNGFMLAAQDFDATGKHIEFIYEDSAYDTAKAVSAFQKLTTVDKVDLVVDWGSGTGFGIAPLTKTIHVPFIAISIDPETVKASDYVIRHNPSPDDYANKLWAYFRKKGYKKIGMVKLKLLFFDKIVESLEKLKEPGESVTIVDTYQSFGDNDFRTSLTKIKAGGKYDMLGVFLASGQIAQFYKQAHALGVSLPTFGSDFFESYTEIKDAGGYMDGAVYANMGASDDFVAKYKAKFGNENQISYAALSYDLGNILLNKVDYSNADSILSSLHAIKNYQGTVGAYSYSNANGDSYLKPQMYIKQIEGNTIKILE